MKLPLFLLILIELLAIGYLDYKYRKIPNGIVLVNIVLFFILLFFYKQDYKILENGNFNFKHFILPLSMLVVGFLMFLIKIMGAGDSKYLFSLFLLLPSAFQFEYLETLIVCIVVIGFISIMYKFFKHRTYMEITTKGFLIPIKNLFITETKVPFVPIILCSWVYFGWENLI